MEIKITTSHILKLMQVLSWIIFIGLCIPAVAIIVSTFAPLFTKTIGRNFWLKASRILLQ